MRNQRAKRKRFDLFAYSFVYHFQFSLYVMNFIVFEETKH